MAKSTEKKTTTRKKPVPKQQVVATVPVEVAPSVRLAATPKRFNVGALFFGLLFVTIGSLFLLANTGIVNLQWMELWRLWPLLVMAAGFSLLATTHIVWKVLSVLFIAAALLLVVIVGTNPSISGGWRGMMTSEQRSISKKQDVKQADIHISAGASKLRVTSEDMRDVVRAQLESRGMRIETSSVLEGETQKIDLSSGHENMMWLNSPSNKWLVTVSETLPVSMRIDAGASSIDADLSHVTLKSLILKAGASSTTLTLGSKLALSTVDIDTGASSMTVRVPGSSAIKLVYEGGLSSADVGGVPKVSDNTYQSADYDTSVNRIDLKVDGGLSSFKLQRY